MAKIMDLTGPKSKRTIAEVDREDLHPQDDSKRPKAQSSLEFTRALSKNTYGKSIIVVYQRTYSSDTNWNRYMEYLKAAFCDVCKREFESDHGDFYYNRAQKSVGTTTHGPQPPLLNSTLKPHNLAIQRTN